MFIVSDIYFYFMLSLSDQKHAHVIDAFYSHSRYLGDLLYIDNNLFRKHG